MGRNAKRRRIARMIAKAQRGSAVSKSAQLSQLAQEHDVPNREARRKAGNPHWYQTAGEAERARLERAGEV